MLPRLSEFPEWHRFAKASRSLDQAEASFGLNLKDALKAGLHHLSNDPTQTQLAADLESVCDAITKSNSSTVFINADIDHLLNLQADFASRRSAIAALDKALKKATHTVARLHKKLTSFSSSSEEARRCRTAIDAALKDEESLRLKFEAEHAAFESATVQYQKSYIQTICTIFNEMSKTRTENERQTADFAKKVADARVAFSPHYSEADAQLEAELQQLRKVVSVTDRILADQIVCRSCSSEADLVMVGERRRDAVIADDSWEDITFAFPVEKPVRSISATGA
jgi:predicted  nucleic acid-binding Zn-ribbon protein